MLWTLEGGIRVRKKRVNAFYFESLFLFLFLELTFSYNKPHPENTEELRLESRVMLGDNKSVGGCGLAKDEASASRIIQNVLLQPKSPNGFKYVTFHLVTVLG